ncbi:MAG: DnaJ C-terminal domain-containing protein, partial [Candidatus Micrarchaeaceae archaeon]
DVNVKDDKNFRRDGYDLITEVSVPFYVFVLGGTIKVPTINGTTELQIKELQQPTESVVLKGMGIPHGNSAGDEIVNFAVEMPKRISKEQRQLIERFAELDGKKRFFGTF